MLPDLPELKDDIQHIIDRALRRLVRAKMGVFSDLDRHTIHEGRALFVQRADGSSSRTGLVSSSGEANIPLTNNPLEAAETRLRVIEEVAEQLASGMSANLFRRLGEELEAAGQSFGDPCQKLTPETLLQALQRVEIDFDSDSKLQVVIPPSLKQAAEEAFERLHSDPELRSRAEALMEEKRRSWRDREASRKLVG